MEKFDTVIEEAKDEHQPSADFVDTTMQKIQPHRPWFAKYWGAVLASGLAVAAFMFIVFPHIGGGTVTNHAPTVATKGATPTTQAPTGASSDAALASDLSGISQSMNTVSGDQTSSDGALNDSQQQIAIPTE